MLVINSPNHRLHNPSFELFEGEVIPHAEQSLRVENILSTLKEHNFRIQEVSQRVPLSLLHEVHDKNYISFLNDFCTSITDQKGHYPSVFPKYINPNLTNQQALLGFYSLDTYTPLMKDTFNAALASASAVYQAAQLVRNKTEKNVYALCRPPGHHAEKSQMGGYCYLNNAAVAAHYLSQHGKVVILDLDFHHGNGTQQIFYDRNDVIYVSVHADPNWKFPHLSGFRNEIGDGKGKGFNINYPLPAGTDNRAYTKTLVQALKAIHSFNPEFLVISLGLDTHQDDPICGFNLTTDYYKEMGSLISQLGLPSVIVQEGGYNTQILGQSVVNFISTFT